MKIKNILMAGVVAITSISVPTLANAETSYATPQELLIEALEVAVSGVESATYDEALDYVESLITVNGSEVSYDSDVIGYWDSTNSDTLFADSAFTNEVLSNGGTNIWEFDPDILSPMLTDFNNKLVETIVPTTEDWSKIIGKYDVTLGDVTVPANQWIEVDSYVTSVLSDLSSLNVLDSNPEGSYGIFSWFINPSGDLFVQDAFLIVYINSSDSWGVKQVCLDGSYESVTTYKHSTNSGVSGGLPLETYPILKYTVAGMTNGSYDPTIVIPVIAMTDLTNSSALKTYVQTNFDCKYKDKTMHNIQNPAEANTAPITENTQYGIAYLTTDQMTFTTNSSNVPDVDSSVSMFQSFFSSQSSSKQQIGNTTLKQRLNKFSSLVEGDTIEVTPTAWTIRGLGGEESDFDTYLGSQDIMAPGEETSIPATADIEALAFKVVLPTSLPIHVNELNQVSVATNATIKNESGAAVIVNSVSIEAKQDSGWTLLTSGTPSKARDAKEFTFTTDLAANTVLAVAEERPFHYNAELSPSTEGVEQLDLAEVLVTIDWAEVT